MNTGTMTRPAFLPMVWSREAEGICSLAWRDDPLRAQLVLSGKDYSRCFPQQKLSWPRLGEILLPSSVPTAVRKEISAEEEGNVLRLTAAVRNTGTRTVQLDTVRLALPMDQCFRENDTFKYEQNVLRHTGLIGRGAWMYWRKPGGAPPLCLMAAQGDTEVSRFHVDRRYGQHGLNAAFEGLYALELANEPVLLSPGEERAWTFALAMVMEEADLPEALAALGGLWADVIPGMAVQRGEKLRLRLYTRREIREVFFADRCAEVIDLGGGLYETTGAGAGEKWLRIIFGDQGESVLKFFVIDPVTDIVRDFARHVAENQLETDPEDPCYHGFLAWNLTDKCRVNRKHNPLDNWIAGGSDEIGLVSGLFLSEKNRFMPEEAEIRALTLHARDFIEQRLTEQPGNRVHRMVPWFEMFEPWAGHGADDVWRAYNYVHVVNIFLNLYSISGTGNYPFMESPRHYLRKAFDYAIAMFSYWMFPEGEGATKYANMGEMNFPLRLLPALREEGMTREADQLELLLKSKAAYFASRSYPFGSEMSFDTTAYEAVYAYGKYAGEEQVCRKAVAATLANRSRTPLWHKYSVDVRGGGDSCWNVSYMTQLGIWPAVDALMEGTLTDPEAAVMAHAAVLGGFCLYNSGGCWDADPVNRHASIWVWDESAAQSGKASPGQFPVMITGEAGLGYFGALYAMCSYLLIHPRMGQTALACRTEEKDGALHILPETGFDRQFCDLVHGFALRCENCALEEIAFRNGQLRIRLRKDSAGGGQPSVWIRRQRGHWENTRTQGTVLNGI